MTESRTKPEAKTETKPAKKDNELEFVVTKKGGFHVTNPERPRGSGLRLKPGDTVYMTKAEANPHLAAGRLELKLDDE